MGASSEHFTNGELSCKHCHLNNCKGVLVAALEQFRSEAGDVPVLIHCAYRCPTYNKKVGGAANSQHVYGLAADISVQGMTTKQMEEIAERCILIKGIGRNDHQGFIHIDCRSTPAKWAYNNKGGWIAYYA